MQILGLLSIRETYPLLLGATGRRGLQIAIASFYL